MRGIRGNLEKLLGGTTDADLNVMRLGLAHSLGRHKLQFSPDKVDTMVVQVSKRLSGAGDGCMEGWERERKGSAGKEGEWEGWMLGNGRGDVRRDGCAEEWGRQGEGAEGAERRRKWGRGRRRQEGRRGGRDEKRVREKAENRKLEKGTGR
eukprot:3109296-Rhodomonas_salina.1